MPMTWFEPSIQADIGGHVWVTHADPAHFQWDVSVFQMNPISRRVAATVVVGRAIVPASNDAPKVSATAPDPITDMRSVSPSTGVPVRFVVNDVIAVDPCAVM